MSGWIILGAEVALLVVCFFGSKWWIKNKSTPNGEVPIGWNEYLTFGEDSAETIEKMTSFAKEIFNKEELLKSDDESDDESKDGFFTKISIKNNEITGVEVRTDRTKVTYDGKECDVTSTVNTKGEILAVFTIMSWGVFSFIPWFLSLVIYVIWILFQVM